MSFSEMLAKLMKDHGTSALALSKAIGVSDVTVGKWIKEEAIPNLNNAISVANFYGISLDELSGNSQNLESNLYLKLPVIGFANNVAVGILPKIYDEYIEITNDELDGYPREECYALRVDGDSLMPKYSDGNYLIVHQQKLCKNGDIVIAMDENRHNQIKLFEQYEDRVELACLSGVYKNIVYTKKNINKLFIQGIVISEFIVI